ncbi:hypothetical protein GA0070558_11659 [Micromonospora haikouensis]|uniref:Neocarzinostatin family protein n=1 Tax=Micromonospora haikouensis TaxID=686309 RepID=A0A1C4WKL2_9ACTN|nr:MULTISPECIES: hypothetical protein [Micromonospora]SCE96673.1 hypothetical protein GA0070558_11659 [Micromonospora haikouensis]
MRALRRAVLTATLITLGVAAGAVPAHAGTGRGAGGQVLTVTPSSGVARAGASVTVSGTGYDVTKGIYVAYCVDNGAGAAPSPCGGGADTTGSTGASHWISSNPPSYGEGLAVPYGAGGSFRVTLTVGTRIGDVDCTVRRCVVATRADHTRPADRSQDVRVPITFAAAATPARTSAAPASTGTAGTATTGPAARTTAPPAATTAAAPVAAAPAGSAAPAATGADAVAAPGGTVDPAAQVTRVSAASGTGGWWLAALVLPLLGLTLLAGLRRRRRKAAP